LSLEVFEFKKYLRLDFYEILRNIQAEAREFASYKKYVYLEWTTAPAMTNANSRVL